MPGYAMLLLAALFFVQIPSISAQDAPEEGPAADPLRAAEQVYILEDSASPALNAAGPSIWTVLRMILTLALAAAAVYGVVFFIKRSSKRGRGSETNDPFLKVLGAAHLGSNRYVNIVSVGTRAWLLGVSEGGVNLISEIDDKDILNSMLLEDSRRSSETTQGRFPDFMAILRRMGVSSQTKTPNPEDIRKRRERLTGL
ncbi:MAG: flagellar biosynthetic protein FliO [Treponema sp.]|jgi:flagellar protein FliO/FliZ|nr:flagellar biosynthetic protein FliO [Treponema sp.]